jgi:hypothetical protein
VSDIDTVVVDSLKTLDPDRPIREADIQKFGSRPKKNPRTLPTGLLLLSPRGNPAAISPVVSAGIKL